MSITNSPPETTTGGRVGRRMPSILWKVRLGRVYHMFETNPEVSRHRHCFSSFRPRHGRSVCVNLTVCMSCRVHGRHQSTNYVDNYPFCSCVSVCEPKNTALGNLERTAVRLLFLHLHKSIETLSITEHIVWDTSENHSVSAFGTVMSLWAPC